MDSGACLETGEANYSVLFIVSYSTAVVLEAAAEIVALRQDSLLHKFLPRLFFSFLSRIL